MTEPDSTREAAQPPVHSIERVTDGAPEGVAVIALGGEFDISSGPQLRSELAAARAEGARRVVLDMGEVGFIDSSMLKELLRANDELRSEGSQLVLAAPQPAVHKLLALTRTEGLFEIAADRSSAVSG